jgi:hypothetical protein
VNFFGDSNLSQAAADLIQFDADSIRQVVSAGHDAMPDVWLADPDGYEKGGRLLRDSDSPRLLAYSTQSNVLYATDGCNSCSRRVGVSLESLPPEDLRQFANENGLRSELLEKLVSLIGTAGR